VSGPVEWVRAADVKRGDVILAPCGASMVAARVVRVSPSLGRTRIDAIGETGGISVTAAPDPAEPIVVFRDGES